MRFVICGAGAIGGVLGGQLAMAGFAVICIDKIAEHVLAINTQGLSTAMAVAREQPGTVHRTATVGTCPGVTDHRKCL